MTPAYKRALTNGLIAGVTVAFFILIGIPSGPSDTEGLPAWFAWGLFLLATGAFAWFAVRPRNPVQVRAQTLLNSMQRGAVVGTAAAALFVFTACTLNAAQLWELSQPIGGVKLTSELPNKITRVQDVFANVMPRTTAVLAGLPLEAIRSADGTGPRTDPTLRFFMLSLLFPLAGVIGAGANPLVRRAREWQASQPASPARAAVREWIVIALPLIFLAFIVANGVLPAQSAAYRTFIGANAQLAGLLASFLLIATGMLAIRGARDGGAGTAAQRLAFTLPVSLILLAVALAAPQRPGVDSFFSNRPVNAIQVTQPDGTVKVNIIDPATLDDATLNSYRALAILAIGAVFVVGNIVGARGRNSLQTLVAVNLLLGCMIAAPLYLDKYQQSVLLLVGINILLGLGLNIVVGYAGLLDLGYVAFYAIGAYVYAFLSSNSDIRQGGVIQSLKYGGNDQLVQRLAALLVFGTIITSVVIGGGLYLFRRSAINRAQAGSANARLPRWAGPALVAVSVLVTLLVINLLQNTALYDSFAGFPAFVIGIVCGVLFAAFAGVLLGIPVLRLRGDYLAIVTLGFGEIIRLFLNNVKDVTGGPQGLLSIPPLTVGSVELGSNEGLLYIVLGGCIVIALLSLRLRTSRLGRAWGALRSDEDIAQAMGINLVNAKVLAFAIGAGFAGIGGVIFAARQANIFPGNFTLQVSINILALVIIGGMGSVPGVVVGALVLIGIPESLRVFESYRILAFGGLLVAMMLLRPGGLLPQQPLRLEERAKQLRRAIEGT